MKKLPENCEGGCTCGKVRFRLNSDPLIVHCCHCRFCQRQTGTAFALNALFVAENVELLQGNIEGLVVDTPSGKGQEIARCPSCRVALWSNYFMAGLKAQIRFIRVGTMDNPDLLPPDVHIYTNSKQPWVQIPEQAPRADEFYAIEEIWSEQTMQTVAKLREQSIDTTPF